MKKIFLFLFVIFLFSGCDDLMNTPTKKVEEFLNKFQTLDKSIVDNLYYLINEKDLTNEEKDNYKELMKKQYENLVYKIKDELVTGDNAIVKVEIEVYDYSQATMEVDDYFIYNQDIFLNDEGVVDKTKYIDYKLDYMKKIENRIKYTIDFYLTKENDTWYMNDITEEDKQKIHGLFSY